MIGLTEKLFNVWSFFAWADKARWCSESHHFRISQLYRRVEELFNKVGVGGFKLETPHFVLTHWLTYIFDYQIPARKPYV